MWNNFVHQFTCVQLLCFLIPKCSVYFVLFYQVWLSQRVWFTRSMHRLTVFIVCVHSKIVVQKVQRSPYKIVPTRVSEGHKNSSQFFVTHYRKFAYKLCSAASTTATSSLVARGGWGRPVHFTGLHWIALPCTGLDWTGLNIPPLHWSALHWPALTGL